MEQTHGGAATETYAGFFVRFIASMIDTIVLACLIAPIVYLVYGAEYLEREGRLFSGWGHFLLTRVLPMVVVVVFWIYKSATPGKMALGLKIVDARTGGAPTAGQAVLRYIAYYVSLLPLALGFFWIIWDERKQGWHDKIAKTYVVKG
jgi:uncharacterized RDD family membrane protein YckC